MALPITLNRSRSSIVFLNAETTAGTIATSPNTNSRFGLTTPPVIGQAGNYTDTSEIGPELISVDRVLNYMDYSTFDFEYYAKPGGRGSSTPIDLTEDTDPIDLTATTSLTLSAAADLDLTPDTLLTLSAGAESGGVYPITVGDLSVDPGVILDDGDVISVTYDGTATQCTVTTSTSGGGPYSLVFSSTVEMNDVALLSAISKVSGSPFAITVGDLTVDPGIILDDGDKISVTYAGTATECTVTTATSGGGPYSFAFSSSVLMDTVGDLTAIAKVNELTLSAGALSGGLYPITVGNLSIDPGIILNDGDTISVTYSGVTTEHIVTTSTAAGYSFTFSSRTQMNVVGNLSAVSKIGAIVEAEEGEILYRTLGGRKYLSSGDGGYTQGVSNTTNVTSANATAIQYFLANSVNTFTVTSRQFTDNSVQMYTATGSLPTSWSVSLAKDGPVTFSSSFQSNRVYYAGTAEVTNSSSNTVADAGTVTYTVTSPLRHPSDSSANAEDIAWFQTGGKGAVVEVANYDASAGTTTKYGPFDVTAVSGATVTLTNNTGSSITVPANGGASDDTTFLIPYTPEPCPDTTSVIDQRSVQVYMTDQLTGSGLDPVGEVDTKLFNSANAIDVTAVSFDFDRSITTPGLTEMTGEEYPPASYVINEPTITGSITLLLRPKDFQLMNSVRAEPHRAIGVEVGTLAGKRIQIAAPSCFLEVPTPGDADGATQIDIPFTVVRGAECEDADKFLVRYY